MTGYHIKTAMHTTAWFYWSMCSGYEGQICCACHIFDWDYGVRHSWSFKVWSFSYNHFSIQLSKKKFWSTPIRLSKSVEFSWSEIKYKTPCSPPSLYLIYVDSSARCVRQPAAGVAWVVGRCRRPLRRSPRAPCGYDPTPPADGPVLGRALLTPVGASTP